MGVPALQSSPGINMVSTSGISEQNILPIETTLYQNYPNPFNPDTKILFSIESNSKVELILFNVLGQEVRKIVNKEMKKGFHSVNLKANDLNSGVYYYTLKTDNEKITKKMLLVK